MAGRRMDSEGLLGAAVQGQRHRHEPGIGYTSLGLREVKEVCFQTDRPAGPPGHKRTGHSHFRKCQKLDVAYVITSDGSLPISCEKKARRAGYKRLVELLRLAMKHFCKYTPKQCEIVVPQSFRRGGDTHL